MTALAMPAKIVRAVLRGITCLHRRMRGRDGYLFCPDCGLDWDEGAER